MTHACMCKIFQFACIKKVFACVLVCGSLLGSTVGCHDANMVGSDKKKELKEIIPTRWCFNCKWEKKKGKMLY